MLTLEHVGKSYAHGEVALKDVSFSVQDGEFVCLIGASGCGKSTVLKIIAGLEEQTSGRVSRPDKVSMVFQSGALFPWLTVIENAAIGLRAEGMSDDTARTHAAESLSMLGLSEFAEKFPRELSGGQRQRVGIARALAVNPQVLLLDEPFSALDPKTTHLLHADLIRLWRDTKVTIVMVSHLIEEAVALGQRILLMRDGSIAETFPVAIPYPRHEQGIRVLQEVEKVRKSFFK